MGKGTNDHDDGLVVCLAALFTMRHQFPAIGNKFAGEGHGVFFAADRQMVCDGIFDDTHEAARGIAGADLKLVQQLHHETSKAFEGAWNSCLWIDFNEHIVLGANEHLQQAGTIQRGVEEHQEALMCNVWPAGSRISLILAHDARMVVAIEQLERAVHLKQ